MFDLKTDKERERESRRERDVGLFGTFFLKEHLNRSHSDH